ncbi:MAG: glutathione S-transferase N-terminal domain-containing protein [Pseudomonadales bacterium]
MQLISSSTSPFAQKVRVVALEKQIQLDITNVIPIEPGSADVIKNPLGKVPTLVLENGELIYDSPVICAYLDSLTTELMLLPKAEPERWRVQRQEALADGIMEAAFNIVMENKRPDAEPSKFWLDRWHNAIDRGLMALSQQPLIDLNVATIASACALNYLGFRLPEIHWDTTYPELKHWHSQMLKRPAFEKTKLG